MQPHPIGTTLSVEALDAIIETSPFNVWLGQQVQSIGDDGIVVRVRWREEFVGAAATGHAHGGIFAALVNSCGCYAVAAKLGRTVPTVDLRCDFHRPGKPGDLLVAAHVVKLGRTLANVDVMIRDERGQHLASGRAVYLTQP
ncbi:PaaI family thioesterase [Hydrocarboniphaga effusa]|uniref:PaaI family thioesterase n=1 Tax=Hydrocarboniphaga effusa TaxID=243629 RepID=UPI00398BF08E